MGTQKKKSNKTSKTNKTLLSFYLLIAPSVFTFAMVVLIPFVIGVYYSFTDWNAVPGKALHFVGVNNYIRIFKEPQISQSIFTTLGYAVYAVIFINIIGFFLAVLVSQKFKTSNFMRTVFFMPNLIGGLILGYVWKFIFIKIIPEVLSGSTTILSTTNGALIAMAIVSTWQMGGYIMIIYLAAIKGIPEELFEAAEIDGASGLQKTRFILFPMVAPAFTISLFLTLSASFKMYDVNVSLTGGDPGRSTELISMEILTKAFKELDFGQGQAQAVIFFVFVASVTMLQVYFSKKREVEM